MQDEESSCAWLDLRPIGAVALVEKYPNIISSCRNLGIDPLERPIPISPAAHYCMGGIRTDDNGRSSLPGLYALGECAATGLHGANRLASNSLLEGGVMAARVARSILSETPAVMPRSEVAIEESLLLASDACSVETIDEFRRKMFLHVGLIRDGKSLSALVMEHFRGSHHFVPFEQAAIEAANIGLVGRLIARSAMARCESRGAHWRADYPCKNDAKFLSRYFISNASSGFRALESGNMSMTKFPGTAAPGGGQLAHSLPAGRQEQY
jgi:aspartate oxidase